MSELYRVSAKGVVLMGDRILLVRKVNGMWDLPGGRLEPGESPEQALIREIREETALAVTPIRLIRGFVRPKPAKPDVFVAAYLCEALGAMAEVVLSHEHDQAGIFTLAEIADLKMEDGYKITIRQAGI